MAQQLSALAEQALARVSGGRTPEPTFVYVVQAGDSLPRLAQRFGTTVRVLRELNGLTDPSRFQVGMRLLIPQR